MESTTLLNCLFFPFNSIVTSEKNALASSLFFNILRTNPQHPYCSAKLKNLGTSLILNANGLSHVTITKGVHRNIDLLVTGSRYVHNLFANI